MTRPDGPGRRGGGGDGALYTRIWAQALVPELEPLNPALGGDQKRESTWTPALDQTTAHAGHGDKAMALTHGWVGKWTHVSETRKQ